MVNRRGWNLRTVAAFSGLTVMIALTACGGEDAPEEQTEASGDVQRYCELVVELEAAGREAFAKVEQDPDATPEAFAEAEASFARDNEAQLDELESAAPAEIADEVELLVSGIRVRGGIEEDAPDPQASSAAEKTLSQFEKENC